MKSPVVYSGKTGAAFRTPLVAFLLFTALFLSLGGPASYAQQKYALVIGNGAYTNVTRLNNPVNDARDMKAALEGLGFTVDLVVNGALDQMEGAATRLRSRLSAAQNSYGFFFYAGHAVQSGGENYLIPVDANIQSENFLRQKAVSMQAVLGELNDAGNVLNIVVLDACRDNPFSWKRGGSRGLQVVSDQPADSIIVYATSAGNTADDNPSGRNGLFTTHLLANLKTPGLSVRDLFDKTGADVRQASGGKQVPAIYSQYFETAYLGGRPAVTVQPSPAPRPAPNPVPVRADISGVALEREDRESPVQIGGTYRYILTRKEVLDHYETGRRLFAGYRDEAAKLSLNRIIESNASDPIKNKARLLISYMEVPGFDTLKDRFPYAEIREDPLLYRDCHVIWKGMVTNIQVSPSQTSFDFLIGYGTGQRLEGIVSVVCDWALTINPEQPLEILGRIVPIFVDGGKTIGIRLVGIDIHQW